MATAEGLETLGISRESCTEILSYGHTTAALGGETDPIYMANMARAAHVAYADAGISSADIDIAEVHDCFTIAELIATEDLGFFNPGEGAVAVAEGQTARNGPKPINTSGGLKAKGHPVGASGAGQITEIWKQLRGEAGQRQVSGRALEYGLTHNVGGTGGTCVINILRRG